MRRPTRREPAYCVVRNRGFYRIAGHRCAVVAIPTQSRHPSSTKRGLECHLASTGDDRLPQRRRINLGRSTRFLMQGPAV
jgi:hypothetical protein